jgi:hypothetical protein
MAPRRSASSGWAAVMVRAPAVGHRQHPAWRAPCALAEAGELLFTTVCRSYVHLRCRRRWPTERARHGLHLADNTEARGRARRRDTARRFVITSAVPRAKARTYQPSAVRSGVPRLADVHVHFLLPGTRGRRPAPNWQLRTGCLQQSLRTRIRRYALADQRSYWSPSSSKYTPPSSIR